MFSNSSGEVRRPWALTAYVNACPGGIGSLPTWPAGLTVFCVLMAETISGTVRFSFASRSGFTHSRMAYWPEPKTWTWPTPFAGQWIVQIDVAVVGQELGVT